MGAHYTIIRYLPNTDTGEFLNVGVLVFGGGDVRARFVADWARLRRFGGGNIRFLQDFAKDIERGTSERAGPDRLTPEAIERMSRGSIHALRLTTPSFSTLDVGPLLDYAEKKFLPTNEGPASPRKSRTAVIELANKALRSALGRIGADASRYIRKNVPIRGKRLEHYIPLVISNGRDRLAIQALTFVGRVKDLTKEITSAAYAIEDLHTSTPQLDSAVVILRPDNDIPLYQQALAAFRDQKATVVTEDQVEQWAGQVAAEVVH